MRQKATTGAPVRSEPKLGNACAWRPCSKAAIETISAAVTTPWPPRPCIRICNIAFSASLPSDVLRVRRVVHARAHMREQVGGPLDAGVALAERDFGDRHGQLRRHLADLRERRKEAPLIEVLLRHLR